MLDDMDAPEGLSLAYYVNCKGKDLVQGLGQYLQERPGTKAVIIDVLQKIRTGKPAGQSEYAYDYDEIGSLKELADQYGIALILVTHCRKTKDRNDWVNEIAGGVGVTGAADTILKLERNSGKGNLDGSLLIKGRDLPEQELAVHFDPESFQWLYAGTADEQEIKKDDEVYASSPVAKAVKLLLKKNNGSWSGTSRELLDFGFKEFGEPIAKNESALARKVNKLDGMFQKDCIIHTKPDPNGGNAGRIHHFAYVEPAKQAQGQDGQDEPSKVIPMGPDSWAEVECGEDELPFN